MDRPKILNLLVGHDDGTVGTYYGIHHEGSLWLVTAWVVSRGEQVSHARTNDSAGYIAGHAG
jgi:hypothetical protein